MSTYYAHVAGASITLQVRTENLAKLPQPEVARILSILRDNGAKAMVNIGGPAFENDAGWVKLGRSGVYARMLR